ncbi:cytochrome P450 [Actinoallomurus sp. NBC_01490]|uniref:cytochrome P450 n=1 Tax=Actinoallomurus sp. NBC_01490 TaxID=2903557 RepID=UPI002E35D530|nr:cytochrome P450 [Actinoallomurus sp. NBC_01490]
MPEALSTDRILALAEPETLRDPYPAYARLRESQPVYWSEAIDSWVLTRYEDCAAVLRNSRAFASDWRRTGERIPTPLLSIQSLDPPEHTLIRHFMVNAVRTLDYPALRQMIADRVRERLARVRRKDSFDAVTEFAAPIALDTIVAVLGVARPDPEWFLPTSQAIVDGMDAGVWPETYEPAVAARARLAELAEGWLADPPDAGLVGYVSVHGADSGIERPILLNTLRAVFHAGFESAGRLLANALAVMAAMPDALGRFAAAETPVAVEELVRYVSPVQADGRACVQETSIGGTVIRRGQAVTMLLGAANRDPARFSDPDALDFGRDPNPHVGFGRGAHSCLGQSLATLQAGVVLGILAAECGQIRAVAAPVYRRNLTLRGPSRFEARVV